MFKKVSKFLLVLTIAVAVLGTTVMADTLIDAGNSPMDYELHVEVQITGSGSVNESPGPNSDAAYPDSVALEAVADSGWYFDHWEVGSVMHVPGTEPGDYTVSPAAGTYSGSSLTVTVSGTDNNGTDENPDGYVTVTAVFLPEQPREVTLYTYTGLGMGTTSPGGAGQTYAVGDTATATATPAPGWQFVRWVEWIESGEGEYVEFGPTVSTDNPYSFPIENNTYLYAIFEEVEDLTVTSAPVPAEGGTTTPSSTVVPYGTVVTLTASPAPGYYLVGWENITTGLEASFNLSFDYTATADADFEAIFEEIPVEEVVVTSVPNDPALGSTTPGSTVVPVGDSVTLSATPSAPVVTTVGTTTTTLTYNFVEWQDSSGAVVSTSPTFVYVANTSEDFTAIFEELESIEEEDIPEDIPEEILDEEIPEDVPMPQTSGIPMEVASLFGGSLVALGTVIKRKRTK